MQRTMMIAVMAVSVTASEGCGRQESAPLPTAAEVKSVTISFDHPELDNVKFSATPADWRAIRKTLLPARRDDQPSDWEGVGSAEFVRHDGSPFRVELYYSNKDPGAFAAGKTFKSRVYYRGGTSGDLIKALQVAFEKSSTREVESNWIRGRFRRADKLEIKVAKDSGGFYDLITLDGDKEEIESLAESLKFTGNAIPRGKGNISTTTAADINAIRKGKTLATFQLRGRQIWFGPEHRYAADLETGDFYRQLRELAGDPLP